MMWVAVRYLARMTASRASILTDAQGRQTYLEGSRFCRAFPQRGRERSQLYRGWHAGALWQHWARKV